MLVKKMEQAAENKGIECKIDAMSVNAFEDVIKEYDVCLLGPQVRFQLEELRKTAQEHGKNIDAISPQHYGMMKGEEVLEQALELIN
ncbi:cytochrome C biogenesis protein CcmE [Vibrio alginolyticus]|nr:PTS system, cellobiose-specific IIB component [Vibrio alginolyticus NBRC 15630 = ATCC 17749]KOE06982.1 cytochrome C biogenesis protein CcmE [Vibrio alginolyticus]GAD73128.1 putative PTS system IIB component [Vibrio alginolyticus NBRC 15630 = ATCC 17749]